MRTNVLPNMVTDRSQARIQALRDGKQLSGENLEKARLIEATKEFEALMVEMMVKEMRKNVPESPLLGESTGRKIFNEMLDGEYVRLITDKGFGLSEMMVKQLGTKGVTK